MPEDMHRSDKASEVLRSLEQQPNIARAHIEFARRSIDEWSHPPAKEVVVEAQPESLDELLANGYFGTAIEILEQKTKEQPQDFDLWLKLAETQAQHCGNINRAEKIIQQIEANPAFSPEQIQLARSQTQRMAGSQVAASLRQDDICVHPWLSWFAFIDARREGAVTFHHD